MSDAGSSRSSISRSSGSGERSGDGSSVAIGSATSPRGTPSNHGETESASCLASRGIEATKTAYDPRFDTNDGAAAIARVLLSSHVGCDDTDGELEKGLTDAFAGTYKREDDFNIRVFEAMARCFEADSSRWKVEFYPPRKEWTKKDSRPRFMVITGRRRTRKAAATEVEAEADAAKEEEEEERAEGATGVRPASKAAVTKGGEEEAFVVKLGGSSAETQNTGRQQRREYAIGFAREAAVPEKESCIVQNGSNMDHALVLYGRDVKVNVDSRGGEQVGDWKVFHVLAAVELKMPDSTCTTFASLGPHDNRVDPKRIKLGKGEGGGPLGQEIMYAFGRVLWSRAALGLGPPSSLPLAVVAALRAKKAEPGKEMVCADAVNASDDEGRIAVSSGGKPPRPQSVPKDKARFVYGRLAVPEERGGRYTYQVASCGGFRETAAESALAVYMAVMMDGLAAGEKWIGNMLHGAARQKQVPPDDSLPWPTPLSGIRLYFGRDSPLELAEERLVGTPARMCEVGPQSSQGELYAGRVSLAKVRDTSQKEINNGVCWWPAASDRIINSGKEENEMADEIKLPDVAEVNEMADEIRLPDVAEVLVKVTSKACHTMLVPESHAFLWNLNKFSSEKVSKVLDLVSGSLHAMYLLSDGLERYGLVQIMPDLLSEGYHPLCPRALDEEGHLQDMCHAFAQLIEKTLVPLALQDVVHTDIRSSYRATFNILFRKKDRTMRLIDLDSLMHIHNVGRLPRDWRIISAKNGPFSRSISSALEFVWLQAICIATSWLKGRELELKIKELDEADPAVIRALEVKTAAEVGTEFIIEHYLKERLESEHFENEKTGGDARIQHFAKGKSDPVSFVRGQVWELLRPLFPPEGRP